MTLKCDKTATKPELKFDEENPTKTYVRPYNLLHNNLCIIIIITVKGH